MSSEQSDRTDSATQEQKSKDATVAAGAETTIDFNTFIISLGTSALFHMGVSLPDGEPGQVNLPLAQNAIDTLAMLESKTKGNLTHDEGLLLSTLLYDLRMRFVQVKREHPASVG